MKSSRLVQGRNHLLMLSFYPWLSCAHLSEALLYVPIDGLPISSTCRWWSESESGYTRTKRAVNGASKSVRKAYEWSKPVRNTCNKHGDTTLTSHAGAVVNMIRQRNDINFTDIRSTVGMKGGDRRQGRGVANAPARHRRWSC